MHNPFGCTPRLTDCDLKCLKKSPPSLVLHMRHTLVFLIPPPPFHLFRERVKIQVRLSATLPLNLCRCETTFSLLGKRPRDHGPASQWLHLYPLCIHSSRDTVRVRVWGRSEGEGFYAVCRLHYEIHNLSQISHPNFKCQHLNKVTHRCPPGRSTFNYFIISSIIEFSAKEEFIQHLKVLIKNISMT